MGIIRTDQWLREEFDRPIELCERLCPYFKGQKAKGIYNQLMDFGMYRPSRSAYSNLNNMVEQKVWDQVGKIFSKYKNKWNGPDVPVFLFPVDNQSGFFFRREEKRKAGVSFPDKMFLFLSNLEDPKELEALLIHEYHHVCRLSMLNKKMEDYTLLDSIVIEGLAEYAVLKYCGKEYLANWCRMYTEKELTNFWDRYLRNQLTLKKTNRGHDELLYGGGRIPKLLGYAAGYNMIRKYYVDHPYSTKLSFTIPAEKYRQ
ncbi:DUF2268 domain-containing protein [Neobacillus sp. MM2021_6]|uniref:DUF2268 domain-containing protein n=1 Tax=Bacillaceae TaxID=186817 RepID=UPI001408F2BA|nr:MULTISPECIES: DUF2268 domain-containing protein [Bacillaceae]MBO0961207.1 DUF2268 domain-containing protein [Neobacillus sp. MM2021_6]NHC20901.1 DUF2268 domain-containing protein [Bacillus sp. MM2020_4]